MLDISVQICKKYIIPKKLISDFMCVCVSVYAVCVPALQKLDGCIRSPGARAKGDCVWTGILGRELVLNH